jgi:hypothetical protein
LYTVRIFAMRETLGGGCSFRTAEAGEEYKSAKPGHHNKPQHKQPEQHRRENTSNGGSKIKNVY